LGILKKRRFGFVNQNRALTLAFYHSQTTYMVIMNMRNDNQIYISGTNIEAPEIIKK